MEFEKDLICSIVHSFDRRDRNPSPNRENGRERKNDSGGNMFVELRRDKIVGGRERKFRSANKKKGRKKRVRFVVPESAGIQMEARREVVAAREGGMAFIMGHSYVRAKRGSGLMKKTVINCGYDFLKGNSRGHRYVLSIPRSSTLEDGMVYHV